MRTLLPLLMFFAACAPDSDAELAGIAQDDSAIASGGGLSETLVAVGTGTFKDSNGIQVRRSVTMLTNDLAIIPASIAPLDLVVALGGKTAARRVVRSTTPTNGDLSIVQLKRALPIQVGGTVLGATPPSLTGFERKLTAVRPRVGQNLFCRGIGGTIAGNVGGKNFAVGDIVGDELFLRDSNNFATDEDIGGPCELADRPELVAIITSGSKSGTFKARLIDKVVAGIDEVRFAVDFSRTANAVSFVDTAGQAMQAPLLRLPRDASNASQGFYLIADLAPPRGGTWYFLMSAKDGLCQATNGLVPCDFTSNAQRWFMATNGGGMTGLWNLAGVTLVPGVGSVVNQQSSQVVVYAWKLFANLY